MDWLSQLAVALEVAPIDEGGQTELLDVARDVAHGVERKVTPLAAFLLGTAVGQRVAAGMPQDEALAGAISDLRALLPD
jgi:hypothetical protein